MIISHRINFLDSDISKTIFNDVDGIEFDIRSSGGDIIVQHDPFVKGQLFSDFLSFCPPDKLYIVNIKSEGIERVAIQHLEEHTIHNFFLLDCSIPMMVRLGKEGERRMAVRFSEYESIDTVVKMAPFVSWVWVDVFSQFPLTKEIEEQIHALGLLICVVSPELQGQSDKRMIYKQMMENMTIDAICTKFKNISPFRNNKNLKIVKQIDDSIRDSFICSFDKILLIGRNLHYPNCLIQENNTIISPYDERVMSLQKESFYDNNEYSCVNYVYESIQSNPCFFFIFNVDNYYHFVYDTLPYLYGYLFLKKTIPTLQLLMNTSHPSKKCFPPFVTDFLRVFDIQHSDIVYGSKLTLYTKLYCMTSLTHGQRSNSIFSSPALQIWNMCLSSKTTFSIRLYISRRSWIHGKCDNLGTNYTTRRRCMNEDKVVDMLTKYGIQEIFTELLTTDEKIAVFRNAELVVGIIGGGMCNLLFSPSNTKSLCITTPHFLDINSRFQHSMNHTNILYSESTKPFQQDVQIQLFTRVRVKNKESELFGRIGEVIKNTHNITNTYTVQLSSNDVAGFSQDFIMEEIEISVNDLESIDNGLNSPFVCNIEQLEHDLQCLVKQ